MFEPVPVSFVKTRMGASEMEKLIPNLLGDAELVALVRVLARCFTCLGWFVRSIVV